MGCECEALRTEVASQRELFVRWFELLSNKLETVEQQNTELINRVNVLNRNEQRRCQTSSEQAEKASESFAANFIETNQDSVAFEADHQKAQPLPVEANHDVTNAISVVNDHPEEERLFSHPDLRSPMVIPKVEPQDFDELKLALNLGCGSSRSLAESIPMAESAISVERECDDSLLPLPIEETVAGTSVIFKRCGKVYKCRVCPYYATSLEDLRAHRQIHAGDKPFVCEFCEHRFQTYSGMFKHKRAIHHTGEKAFKCDMCDYFAFDNWKIKRHWTRVHGRKMMEQLQQMEHLQQMQQLQQGWPHQSAIGSTLGAPIGANCVAPDRAACLPPAGGTFVDPSVAASFVAAEAASEPAR